ncbi:MAG: hypothetical protein KDA96_25385, partial [Planctomycetaceae bacterium]|nr:hypothetical protein [Planctomycetaceae bacterium]
MKSFLFTFSSTADDRRARLLRESCRLQGVQLDWIPCQHTSEKPRQLVQRLSQIPSDSLVCCVDGFDVLCGGPLDDLVERWGSFDRRIVFGAEKCCFHHFESVERHFEETSDGPCRFLNGGMFLGASDDLREMMETLLRWDQTQLREQFLSHRRAGHNFNDQTLFGYFAAQHPDRVALDTNSDLFWNVWGDYDRLATLFSFEDGRLRNNGTGTYPRFIHLSQIDRYYRVYV